MRNVLLSLAVLGIVSVLVGCESNRAPSAAPTTVAGKTVEAGCATCTYNLQGVKGCKLAVKIDGKPYLVTGADDVDAHKAGLCDQEKSAVVDGKVEGDKFAATSFEFKP